MRLWTRFYGTTNAFCETEWCVENVDHALYICQTVFIIIPSYFKLCEYSMEG